MEELQIRENHKGEEEEEHIKQDDSKNPSTPSSVSPPPSSSSSPSHEFSFTISLHSASTPTPTSTPSTASMSHKTKSTAPPFAIDLSPADDIFFHGHLLPLHLLAHFPVSPRSSTNSLDSFTLPIKELMEQHHQHPINNAHVNNHSYGEFKNRPKAKTFSLFGLKNWKKGCEETEKEEQSSSKEKIKRKQRFDLSHVLKRYVRMVRPLFLYRGRRDSNGKIHKQAYSFSGNLSLRHTKQELIRGRRGEYSAPASMRTSPTNSGLLVSKPTNLHSSTNDSTMEELQSAIQAAIAHCKNSIASQDKPK